MALYVVIDGDDEAADARRLSVDTPDVERDERERAPKRRYAVASDIARR